MEKTVTEINNIDTKKNFVLSIDDTSGGAVLLLLAIVLGFLLHGEPDVMDAIVEITRAWLLK